DKSNAVKALFTDEDGSLNKSNIARLTSMLASGGVVAKMTDDHINNEEEDEQRDAYEEETLQFLKFFYGDDGALDMAKIAVITALLLGNGYTIKKANDNNSGEEQQLEDFGQDCSSNHFKLFFASEDGSVDKSHAFAAGTFCTGIVGFRTKYY
ncbi:hypothetical protein LPJ61_006851, partial [Coemansia biformis]